MGVDITEFRVYQVQKDLHKHDFLCHMVFYVVMVNFGMTLLMDERTKCCHE